MPKARPIQRPCRRPGPCRWVIQFGSQQHDIARTQSAGHQYLAALQYDSSEILARLDHVASHCPRAVTGAIDFRRGENVVAVIDAPNGEDLSITSEQHLRAELSRGLHRAGDGPLALDLG